MRKNKFEFIIDSEFQSQIPALTDEEFQQLEENILSEGEVLSPLISGATSLLMATIAIRFSSSTRKFLIPPVRSPAPAKPVKMFLHGSANISWVAGI